MPDISEIVDVTISVQSSALSRKGFNSLLVVGAAADFGVGFAEYEVRKYTTYAGVVSDTDIVSGDLKNALQVAFAQSPSVPSVYVSRVDAAAGALVSGDLDSIAANNSEWFGYAHVWEDATNNGVAATWAAANKKYAFLRQVDFTDQSISTNYASLWYTDSTANTGAAKFLDVAIASRVLALIPGSYTTAFKSLEVVGTSSISTTNENNLRTQNVNQYSSVAGRSITWDGKATAGGFIDTYIGVLYLEARIQEDVFAQLAAVNKVPYTNAGVSLISSAVQNRLNQSVTEGFLSDDPAPSVSAPLVTEISAVDKSNRLLPNVTFEAVTAGAIHNVQIVGTIIA